MNIASEVKPGANRYVSGQGTLNNLEEYLADFKNPVVVTGHKSFEAFSDYYDAELNYPIFRYDETASYEDGEFLAKKIGQADVVVGIGGGRLLDTAKMVAQNLDAELITVPTLISNCAPFTPVAAVYHPDRSFREIGYFRKAPYLTLVDTKFLLCTPVDYFVAGIGDTLAKWYEIDGIVRNLPEEKLSAYITLGIASAKVIRDLLMTNAQAAVNDLNKGEVTLAFEKITDTIVALAGEVGGFAGVYGRSAGAHATHDGLSYLHETHEMLHGKKVAYGILVQLAHTEDYDIIEDLLPFYKQIGLPSKLAEVNVKDVSRDYLAEFMNFSVGPNTTFRLVDEKITAEDMYKAIQYLEGLED
ncbi:alcohol dehydrogenase [Floricoccus penangensis]|uniref:Alcohol dehydrogenase n=1 Tax=Floricoccus penangensis TaxID=1859475 RepID=A0A9Q5P072_9LACT|nr:iron-containing alcohol dehydrogenase family protein [Floricoccus penangensis]OFI45965.1 alcohol dehydrogenase [Floricoccus penangensis]